MNGDSGEKPRKRKSLFSFLRNFTLPGNIKLIGLRELVKRIRRANLYGTIRERFVRFYLRRTAHVRSKNLTIAWQPFHFILVKVIVVSGFSYLLFLQFPLLSGWIGQGLAFFRLSEIYNFKYPDKSFFDSIAKWIILCVIGYYGLYFCFYQLQALFSSLAVSPADNKLYYIRNFILKKDLHIFTLSEIDYVILRQNLFFRLFGIGTIVLKNKAGETVVIRSMKYASHVIKKIADARGVCRQGSTIRGKVRKRKASESLGEIDRDDDE